jgi:hypothetical protein
MASLSGISFSKQARALAAALTLGSALFALAPGQTAHAAWGIKNEADASADGVEIVSVYRDNKPNPNDWPKCTITTSDGEIHFYLPGDRVIVKTRLGNKELVCGGPDWLVVRTEEPTIRSSGGGVLKP